MQLKARIRKLEQDKADEWDTPFDGLNMIPYEDAPWPDVNYFLLADDLEERYPDLNKADAEGLITLDRTGKLPEVVETDKGKASHEKSR